MPAPKIEINIDKNLVRFAGKLCGGGEEEEFGASPSPVVVFDDFHGADIHAMTCFKLPVI